MTNGNENDGWLGNNVCPLLYVAGLSQAVGLQHCLCVVLVAGSDSGVIETKKRYQKVQGRERDAWLWWPL